MLEDNSSAFPKWGEWEMNFMRMKFVSYNFINVERELLTPHRFEASSDTIAKLLFYN